MTEQEKRDIQDLFEAMGRTDARFCIGQVVGSQVNYFYGRDSEETPPEGKRTEKQPKTHSVQSRQKAVAMAIKSMIVDGDFLNKKDFGALTKVVNEMRVFEKFTHHSLLMILAECEVPSSLMPSESSLKALTFAAALHPNWKITGVDPSENQRIINIGQRFKDLYRAYLLTEC